MIEFKAVTKKYPDGTVAVDHLDLAVDAGRITVFVGPSGCGKTTSLRMINRMIDPTSGSILLDGKDIRESDPPLLRRGIGYVIQQAGLFPHRTVIDNVATVPLLTGVGRRIAQVAWRPGGDMLAIGSQRDGIVLWDARRPGCGSVAGVVRRAWPLGPISS